MDSPRASQNSAVYETENGQNSTVYDAARPDPELRGEIAWSYEKPIHCRRRSPTHFDVCTEDRDFHLAAYGAGGARAGGSSFRGA